ncbi:acyltransferase [Aquabacterium sp.]|uniref:acyltransferase n=1 Tax=Aquabacterium sp. TaxID=1872578 RepID=UPI002487533F|nr:acyltransferase [Aquabacterium sp.]MDI1259386.1 acyltransferase [Aquabacterium sp.]
MRFNKKQVRTVGRGVFLLNLIFQRFFRINAQCAYNIHYTSRVSFPERIRLTGTPGCMEAEICFASSIGCYIQARNGVIMDNSVRFAAGVRLISANHDEVDRAVFSSEPPITLHRNVWLGANVVVLPGVEIGENTIIGAGSIVTHDIPANMLAAGVPCKVMRSLRSGVEAA